MVLKRNTERASDALRDELVLGGKLQAKSLGATGKGSQDNWQPRVTPERRNSGLFTYHTREGQTVGLLLFPIRKLTHGAAAVARRFSLPC